MMTTPRSAVVGLALVPLLIASRLAAQTPVLPPPEPPERPALLPPALSIVADTTAQPFECPNGSLLRPGTVVYDLTSTRAGQVASLGVRTVQVAEATLAGAPAWLVTEQRTGTAVATSDSLYLARMDLAPQRWVATSGRSQLGAAFARDSLFGALQSYQGRSSFTTALGSGVLVTPGMVERIVELLPLHVGYRALASLVVIELGTPRSVPAEIVVDREEPLQLADHTVDCWVVTLRAGTTEQRLWVTKEAARVVKTEQTIAGATLTAIARP
jgi:hypothetical protein